VKYRVIKTKNDDYYVQKKILFFWKTLYYRNTGSAFTQMHKPWKYTSLEEAKMDIYDDIQSRKGPKNNVVLSLDSRKK
jgi:hypothetical protein